VQADAGDHSSREVHQGIREVAIVQVRIGSTQPGVRKRVILALGVPLGRQPGKRECTLPLFLSPGEAVLHSLWSTATQEERRHHEPLVNVRC
jgi:hypothetical protein